MDTDQVHAEIDKLRKKLAALAALAVEMERDVFALQNRLAAMESAGRIGKPAPETAEKYGMNKGEFAVRLGVSVSMIEKAMRQGKIKPVKVGRRVLFREHHITLFLDAYDLSKQPKILKR